ncbi:hypothetical protein DDZ13_10070 [Coraliomargarita sinensis]|uniref:Uncharacterized protein n=1 Tax=Coraliomargarita sinensis TaxID=2174842 RepID=A0A317ZER5_9BACT|nr:hypothetical protein DDZ13_10070 [Coraliomargarita sinensis]
MEAQPLMSHMEEGDRIQIQMEMSSCFRVFDNIYEFEMIGGETICTALLRPDRDTPEKHSAIAARPKILSKPEIKGIDSEITGFRRSTNPKPLETRTDDGVTYMQRGERYSASTTSSKVTLTFYEKGEKIIEESIYNPDFNRYFSSEHPGLRELLKVMQQSIKDEPR